MKAPNDIYGYCRAYEGYFYTWESDEGHLVAVADRQVVCYLDQLGDMLRLSTTDGAPPFGTLLLALIATGEDGRGRIEVVKDIFRKHLRRESPEQTAMIEKSALEGPFAFLHRLSALPPEYRDGTLRKQLLLSIFKGAHNIIAGKRIRRYLEGYSSGYFTPSVLQEDAPFSLGVLYADLSPLEMLNRKFPTTESILASLTDLPDIEELPPLPEPPPPAALAPPEDFLTTLERDRDAFFPASLVRRIWSGLSIPFHTHFAGLQPLGGVSDLSNKGSLDRLLISEYANDDLLFLLRLANGEALYINHEVPPETERHQRIILIDSSLQAWGTPRTIAFALLLAIALHPKTDMACTAFAVGEGYEPIAFGNTLEVVRGLQVLFPVANAAPGLEKFLKELPADKARTEVFFLSSPEGFAERDVQRVIHERLAAITYCMTADNAGVIQVYRRRGGALPPLMQFTLPLETLWASPPAAPKPQSEMGAAALPSKYPLLFPTPTNPRAHVTALDGQVFAVSSENCLLQRCGESASGWKGWKLLRSDMPVGNARYCVGVTKAKEYLLLCYAVDKREVHLYNLTQGAHAITRIDRHITGHGVPDFFYHEESFITIHGITGWQFSLQRVSPRHEGQGVLMTKLEGQAAGLESWRAEWLRKVALMDAHHPGAREPFLTSGGLLRNIRTVGVTAQARLLLNQHVLGDGHHYDALQFYPGKERGVIFAEPAARNKWTFPNGYSVILDRNGMLMLDSGDKAMPVVFLPSLIDARLGAATKEYFAGTTYFDSGDDNRRITIPPKEFYNRFIAPFLQRILPNGTEA